MDERSHAPRHPSSADVADLRWRLAEAYAQGAEALERTARLADELADWAESQGRAEYATEERDEAVKARDLAAQSRANAQRLRG